MTLKRSGQISVVADAYGTIILPNGTFKNVLRLKIVQDVNDTLPAVVPGMPSGSMITKTETYAWVSNDFKFGLLSISFISSETKFPGLPSNPHYSSNVQLYDFTPPNDEKTLSPPTLKSPINGAKDLSLPVKLEWDDSILQKINKSDNEPQSIVTYSVYVADNPEFSSNGLLQSFETTTTNLELSDLHEGTTYYWKVKGQNGDIVSEWSDTFSYTTVEPKLETPTLISPANGATDIPYVNTKFVWNGNNLSSGFGILITNDNTTIEVYSDGNATSYIKDELEPNTTYHWKMKFYNAKGDSSDWSEEWTFTTSVSTSVEDNSVVNSMNLQYMNFDNTLSINFEALANQDANLNVYDMQGNVVLSQTYNILIGTNNIIVGLPKLSSGVYFIQFSIGKGIYNKTIIMGH